MGLKRIWGIIRGFQARNTLRSTGIYNDPTNPSIIKLQNELVNDNIQKVQFPFQNPLHTVDPMNLPFSKSEFDFALTNCKRDSAPRLDAISYNIIKKLPPSTKSLLLDLFNYFFVNNNYPNNWKDNLILFIPKPEGKGFRPIALSSNVLKMFERLVHRRLEFLSEHNR